MGLISLRDCLRIHRTFEWKINKQEPLMIGGPHPGFHLEHKDTLQVRIEGDGWLDVPIVEAEKPAYPDVPEKTPLRFEWPPNGLQRRL